MPRIDPYTLIKTLGLLLSPKGGIRSSEEVTRIVQLMQKFSKKMVSKCMYIQILKATKSEILEKFLHEKGWDLLNSWLSEALLVENWAQCKELIKLFLECPMTAGAIKKNEALKLVKQLTCDIGVEEQVKQLALQFLKKFMSIINPSGDHEDLIPLSSRQRGTETSDAGVDLKSNVDSAHDRIRNKEILSVAREGKPKNSKKVKIIKRKNIDDDEEVSKLSSKTETERERNNEKTKSKKHDGEKKEERKEKDRILKKSKPYSRTELKDDLGETERSRIKLTAQKMKDDLASKKDSSLKGKSSVKNSSTSGLDKMEKITKKADKEKGATSFNDMLGALDGSIKAKKTVKVAPSKNKNKGLMESLSSTDISKASSSKHKRAIPTSAKPLLPNSSRDTIQSSTNKVKSDNPKDIIYNSSPIVTSEMISDKRAIEMDHPVEKSKAGLKECDIFGTVLSTAMHDDLALNDFNPRKKKLRLSDVRTEKAVTETPKMEPENDTSNDVNMADGIVQASKSDVEEIKVIPIISIISRGPKMIKRQVHWKPDEELVHIEYFELDKTERINVNKFNMSIVSQKVNKVEFDTMRQREAAMEKEKFGTLANKVAIEDVENSSNRISWKLVELDSESAEQRLPPQESGRDSQEKVTQAKRELGVLQAIIFNKKTPPEPSEPDFCVTPEADPTLVHFEDVDVNSDMFAYSETGWCPGVDSRQKSQQSNGINSTVQPEKNQDSLVNHGLRIKSVDNALLAVEPNGQERLLPPSLYFEQVGEPLGPVSDNGTSHKSYYMDPNIQSPQENKIGPVTFYGNGMGEPSQENKVGPVTFYGNGMGESSQENKVGSVTFYGNGMGGPGNGCAPEPISCAFPVNGYGSAVNQVDQGENNRFHEEVDQNSSWNRGQARGFSNRNRGNRGNNGRGGGGFRNNQNKPKDGIAGGRGGKQINRCQRRQSVPCKFWLKKGGCNEGDKCRFKHDSQ